MKNDIIAGVLISIKPKWCKLIASGSKTIELRKTKSKYGLPLKCYIYECKGKKLHNNCFENNDRGKVIGEFVCDKIDKIVHGGTSNENIQLCIWNDDWTHRPILNEYIYQTGLTTYAELDKYSDDGNLYGWHISDLKIYDEPKELSDFGLNRAPQSWCYTKEIEI